MFTLIEQVITEMFCFKSIILALFLFEGYEMNGFCFPLKKKKKTQSKQDE